VNHFNCEICDTEIIKINEKFLTECKHYKIENANEKLEDPKSMIRILRRILFTKRMRIGRLQYEIKKGKDVGVNLAVVATEITLIIAVIRALHKDHTILDKI
jgi:hypothetical protein